MNIFKKSAAAGLAALCALAPAQAGEIEDAIVAKVTQAYGGDTLVTAKSITITDYGKSPWPGQNGSPGQPDFFRDNAELTIDFEGKRKSMLSWRVSRTGKDLDIFVFDGEKGRIYDVLNAKYSGEDWLNFESLGRSVVGASDTMIARTLADAQDSLAHDGDTPYRGALHHKLRVNAGTSAEYTLYINTQTGLISKRVRQHARVGEISHIFANHQKSGGVTFAQDMNFFVGGEARKISVERNIEINPSLADKFPDAAAYTPWGEPVDTAEMMVREVDFGVYHAGKGRSFTLFVDAGEYFIASGGQDALKASLEALQAQLETSKPLKYFILTHHHSEHLGVLADVAELGAALVTTADHLATAQAALPTALPDDKVTLVDGKASFGEGAVQVFDIATAHAEHYLLVYVPTAKLVFGEDHFEAPFKVGRPRVHKDMVTFRNSVRALGLDVAVYVDGHGPRALSADELNTAVDAYRDVTCPAGYRICAKG